MEYISGSAVVHFSDNLPSESPVIDLYKLLSKVIKLRQFSLINLEHIDETFSNI